jgi:hypothetical protein
MPTTDMPCATALRAIAAPILPEVPVIANAIIFMP